MTRTEAARIADACRAEQGTGAVCGASATWSALVARLGNVVGHATGGQFTAADFNVRARQAPLFEEEGPEEADGRQAARSLFG
jgi:hypothetical protein